MKLFLSKSYPLLAAITLASALLFTSPAHAQFSGVKWSRDNSNSPEQDKSGKGSTPSTKNATNNQGTYQFKITTSSTSGTQRQEFKYERRKGYMQMQTEFRISNSTKNFDKIALAQNHDDQKGSEGVFSIYQVRKSGSSYVFGVQGDTKEANNGYSKFDTVKIKTGKYYRLKVRSYIAGKSNSVEIAELYDGNKRIWRETIKGGGDSEGYYKIGVYKLSGGKGPITADFKKTRFWKGSK